MAPGVPTCTSVDRGVAQPGRAPGSGPGGRRFESSLPDHSCLITCSLVCILLASCRGLSSDPGAAELSASWHGRNFDTSVLHKRDVMSMRQPKVVDRKGSCIKSNTGCHVA